MLDQQELVNENRKLAYELLDIRKQLRTLRSFIAMFGCEHPDLPNRDEVLWLRDRIWEVMQMCEYLSSAIQSICGGMEGWYKLEMLEFEPKRL